MEHFLAVALTFPAVVYTVLLGVVLVYWVFVIVGAAHVDLLGEGAGDALAGGGVDGVAKGALEGAAKGVLEGASKGMLEGAAHHLEGLEGGGEGHAVPDGASTGILSALKLRSAPATLVLSLIVLFAWIFTMLGMQLAERLPPSILTTLVELALLLGAPFLALFPTSVLVRPLGRVFTPPSATRREELVGKLCTIRTGTVTDRFGEAMLEDGGAGLVVRVRVDAGDKKLARGDQAVIVGYDADRQQFTVAALDELLESDPPAAEKGRAR